MKTRSWCRHFLVCVLHVTIVITIASHARAEGVNCSVFNDSYTQITGKADAIYNNLGRPCVVGGPRGECRRWFGRCTTEDGTPVKFSVFNDGYKDITGLADAVYVKNELNSSGWIVRQKACVPGGPIGQCRRWVGRGRTSDERSVLCYLFDDGYTRRVGPTDAIYFRISKVCMPDGTSTGTCRRWFGRCFAQ